MEYFELEWGISMVILNIWINLNEVDVMFLIL